MVIVSFLLGFACGMVVVALLGPDEVVRRLERAAIDPDEAWAQEAVRDRLDDREGVPVGKARKSLRTPAREPLYGEDHED